MGLGNDSDHDQLQEVHLPPLKSLKPTSLAFGADHTLILFPNKQVYSSGGNKYGQCGILNQSLLKKFTEISGSWIAIAAGWEFSILLSETGDLYSCGYGPRGELGQGKDIKNSNIPRKIDLSAISNHERVRGSPVCQVMASLNHVVARLENGTFIGWGTCRKGQLGSMKPTSMSGDAPVYPRSIWEPQVLELPEGPYYTVGKERTVVYDVTGIINGPLLAQPILGRTSTQDTLLDLNGCDTSVLSRVNLTTEPSPQSHCQLSTVIEIGRKKPSPELIAQCGWSSFHFWKDGDLWSFGKNLHGQLFNRQQNTQRVTDFAIGSEHGAVLLQDGTVQAWGWGEHGNCGPGAKDFTLNQVYQGETVVGLSCGLATTWIITECL